MDFRALLSSVALLVLGAGAAGAHPHIFIDTAFELVIDDEGQVAAVRIDWSYDAFYSLLMIEEHDLDSDGDGLPEQGRLDVFAGRDVDWEAGFPGDFVIEKDGAPVALGRPLNHAARFEDGRIVTSHTRPLESPFPAQRHDVVVRSYDPTYFVAYDVPLAPTVAGRANCRLARDAADRAAAEREYGDQLAEIDATGDPFEAVDLPDIGILFADSFTLRCNGSS